MTISGTFTDAKKVVRASETITVVPRSAPLVGDGAIITSKLVTFETDSGGAYEVELAPGNYKLQIGEDPTDVLYWYIPDEAGVDVDGSEDGIWFMFGEEYARQIHKGNWYLPAAGINYQFNSTTGYLEWRNLTVPQRYYAQWVSGAPGGESDVVGVEQAFSAELGLAPRAVTNARYYKGFLQTKNFDTGLWHDEYSDGADGAISSLIVPAGYPEAEAEGYIPLVGFNFRYWRGYLQRLNNTTGKYNSQFIEGDEDESEITPTLAFANGVV